MVTRGYDGNISGDLIGNITIYVYIPESTGSFAGINYRGSTGLYRGIHIYKHI